jgi:hypothetical protein
MKNYKHEKDERQNAKYKIKIKINLKMKKIEKLKNFQK